MKPLKHSEHAPARRPHRATDLLRQHHAEIDDLFRRLGVAELCEREDLSVRLAQLLVAHGVIEKELAYPLLARIAEAEILRAYEEQAIIEQCLAKLCEVKTTHKTFSA